MLIKRKAGFDAFYNELIPALVDFVRRIGIQPAHEVLNHAVQYAPYLARALRDMEVDEEQDRMWLLTRMGYFIGEYFVQKYGGCWYVNDVEGSRYFARFVVGQFARIDKQSLMVDPFEVAQVYVDARAPRDLDVLLSEVEVQLI